MFSIVTSPDPVLNRVCDPCVLGGKRLKRLAYQMAQIMYSNGGCGLAAPQVGVSSRLVVIDCDQEEQQNPLFLVNPELIETKGDLETAEEGCLSIPGIAVSIERPVWARVQYYDLEGELWELEGDGLLGRCLQHELDHLNGITLFERCTPDARLQALANYELALACKAKPGDTSVEQKAV